MDKLGSCEKAQISIEFIIIIAAIVAVVLILVGWMQDTATTGTEKMDKKTEDIFDAIDKIK